MFWKGVSLDMKADCEVCDREPSILGATSRAIGVGEKCYSKLVEKNISWVENTPLSDIIEGEKARSPRPISPSRKSPDEEEFGFA